MLGDSIYSFIIWLVSGLYHVASWVFELFIILATNELVSRDSYSTIISNFYVVLGIILLFYLSFALLRGMVNPEDQKSGTSTVKKVIINLVSSAFILAILPTIFSFAYDFQTSVLVRQNVIGKFFGYGSLGDNSTPISRSNRLVVESASFQIVNGVYSAFFNVNPDWCGSHIDDFVENDVESIKNCQQEIVGKDSWGFGLVEYDNGAGSLYNVMRRVEQTGRFNLYNDFSVNVTNGEINFSWFLSLIAAIALLYVGFSFCFDMALRMIKLVFYQIIAPIPIFARVVPEGKLSDSFSKWVKAVFACYFEVYIRIFVFYFVIFLCKKLLETPFFTTEIYYYGPFIGLLGQAFILMGLVMFMRQAPKLISDITGIDSGKIKLGIRDKLRDGGLFAAGSIMGAGATGFARNLVNASQNGNFNFRRNYQDARQAGRNGFRSVLTSVSQGLRGAGSVIAGTTSSQVRSLRSGFSAKSFSDIRSATSNAANGATAARDARNSRIERYHASGQNVVTGHVSDIITGAKEWAGFGVDSQTLSYYDEAFKQSDSLNSASEATYKKKQAYVDQQALVKTLTADADNDENIKALKSKLKQAEDSGDTSLANDIRNQINNTDIMKRIAREKATLTNLQITEAMKAKVNLSTLATSLGKIQKDRYSGDERLIKDFSEGLTKAFRGVDVSNLNWDSEKGFVDSTGKQLDTLDIDTQKIYHAILNGEEVDDSWIHENNIVMLQDAFDNVNNKRRDTKGRMERANIMQSNSNRQNNDKK